MEIWKDIIGYEKLYQISNFGRVKSLRNVKGIKNKILILSKRCGYPCIELNNKRVAKKYNIHRLLAIHFIPNPHNLPLVEHLNDVKTDLRLENLIWSTYKDNNKRAFSNGINKGRTKLTETQVLEIRSIGKNMTKTKIGLIYGVTRVCISNVLKRKTHTNI